MCWIDTDFGIVQAGLTLVVSLAITAISTSVMIWSAAWHPKVLVIIAFASALSCVSRLWRKGIPLLASLMEPRRDKPWLRIMPLIIGFATWAYGLERIHLSQIGPYGLLASANIWFGLGLAIMLGGGLAELHHRRPLAWLLCAYLLALIVAIYAAVPLLSKAPEYSWVYKHIHIIEVLGHYGRVTDPSNIYQQWPALFAAVAAVSGLSQVGPLRFADWAPLAFELADALLLLGIFRMVASTRRAAYLALFLYEGLIVWVGQDYLSPQAFGYLLWLGVAAIIVRWMLIPRGNRTSGRVASIRARLLRRMPATHTATDEQRRIAFVLLAVIFFAIVAAHQLSPYMGLLGVGILALLGVLWKGWSILAALSIEALGFLVPRYGLISSQFGGLFSGFSANNASGVQYVARQGAEAFTAEFVHYLAAAMWLITLFAVARHWRTLGRVAVPAVLAFSPFAVVLIQNYGGEAIYRVFMFSSPWCAILIADLILELPESAWRRLVVIGACVSALGAGLQGSYGAVAVDAFTSQETSAALWITSHAPDGALIVTAAGNFPLMHSVEPKNFKIVGIPADPLVNTTWFNEANMTKVDKWLTSFKRKPIYVIFSRSMAQYATYFTYPRGYFQLEKEAANTPIWGVVYHNADTTIYQVGLLG